MRACRDCHRISEETDTCPACSGQNLSKDWTGFVVVIDPKRSVVAQKMQIEEPGKYALKVR